MIGRELEFDIGEEPEELLTQTLTRLAYLKPLSAVYVHANTSASGALSFIRGFSRTVTPYLRSSPLASSLKCHLVAVTHAPRSRRRLEKGVVLLRRKAFHEVLTDIHLLVSVVNFMKSLLIMQSYNAMRGCNQFSTPPTVDAIFKYECIARWYTAFVLVPSMS